MLAWTGEVNVNNVRQAGPGVAFMERGNSRNNCFVKFALVDKQRYHQMISELNECEYIRIAALKFKPSRFRYFLNLKKCVFNVVLKRRFLYAPWRQHWEKWSVSLFFWQGAAELSLLFQSLLFGYLSTQHLKVDVTVMYGWVHWRIWTQVCIYMHDALCGPHITCLWTDNDSTNCRASAGLMKGKRV